VKARNYADKLNIGVITQPFNDMVGITILGNLIDYLLPISNKVFVISGNFTYKSNGRVHIVNLKGISQRESIATWVFKQMLIQLRISFSLLRIIRNIDILIFFLAGRIYSLPMLLAKLLRRKTVVVAGGSAVRTTKGMYSETLSGLGGVMLSQIAGVLEKTNLRLADQIAVETEGAVHLLGLDKYRDKITINGSMYIDTSLFKIKRSSIEKRKLVGYIGRLSGEKGVMNFAKAVPLILKERNDIEFLIGGGGRLLDELKGELKRNGCSDKVKFLGWIPHEELPDYLNELKIVVLPSSTEGLPGIVQEGMACGTIVVATPVGGVPDLVKDGETGFILEDNSPECIAKTVIKALVHPHLDEIAKAARKLIEDEYAYDVMVEKCRESLSRLKRE